MTTKANKKTISLIILLTAVVISAALIFYTLRFFIDAFLGSLIFYVLFRKLQRYLTQTRKWKRGLSGVVIILITLLIVVIPVTIVLDLIIPRIYLFFSDNSITMNAFKELD